MAENKSREVRYKEILDAASLCFAEKGYKGTSVNDICKEADITKGGLYWHFSSKKEILKGLMNHLCDIQQEQWKLLETIPINEKSIRQVGLGFIKANLQDISKARLFAVLEVESLQDGDIKKLLGESRGAIHGQLALFASRIVEHYGSRGIDVPALAHFLELSVSAIVRKKILDLVDIDVEETWNTICDSIMKRIE